jgi:hypothetical protein
VLVPHLLANSKASTLQSDVRLFINPPDRGIYP